MCRFNHVVVPAAEASAEDELGGPVFDDLSGLNALNWFSSDAFNVEVKNDKAPQMPPVKQENAFSPESNDLDMAEELDLYELFKEDEVNKPASSASQPSSQLPLSNPMCSKPADSTSAGNFCGLSSLQQQQQQLAAAQFMNPALLSQPMQNIQQGGANMPLEQLLAMQTAAAAGMINPLQAQLLQNLQMAALANMSLGLGKSTKAPLSAEESAIEKIKQKRRESAQRSRARKNSYMRQLEFENRALKDEVIKLTQALSKIQKEIQAGNITLNRNNANGSNAVADNTTSAAAANPSRPGSYSHLIMSAE